MENKLTPELVAKAKQVKSVEEFLALAKENGLELSEEEAKAYFEQLSKTDALSDEELAQIAGGVKLPPGQVETSVTGLECPKCHSTDILEITGPYINSKHYCKKCHYCALKMSSDFIHTGANSSCSARY